MCSSLNHFRRQVVKCPTQSCSPGKKVTVYHLPFMAIKICSKKNQDVNASSYPYLSAVYPRWTQQHWHSSNRFVFVCMFVCFFFFKTNKQKESSSKHLKSLQSVLPFFFPSHQLTGQTGFLFQMQCSLVKHTLSIFWVCGISMEVLICHLRNHYKPLPVHCPNPLVSGSASFEIHKEQKEYCLTLPHQLRPSLQ